MQHQLPLESPPDRRRFTADRRRARLLPEGGIDPMTTRGGGTAAAAPSKGGLPGLAAHATAASGAASPWGLHSSIERSPPHQRSARTAPATLRCTAAGGSPPARPRYDAAHLAHTSSVLPPDYSPNPPPPHPPHTPHPPLPPPCTDRHRHWTPSGNGPRAPGGLRRPCRPPHPRRPQLRGSAAAAALGARDLLGRIRRGLLSRACEGVALHRQRLRGMRDRVDVGRSLRYRSPRLP